MRGDEFDAVRTPPMLHPLRRALPSSHVLRRPGASGLAGECRLGRRHHPRRASRGPPRDAHRLRHPDGNGARRERPYRRRIRSADRSRAARVLRRGQASPAPPRIAPGHRAPRGPHTGWLLCRAHVAFRTRVSPAHRIRRVPRPTDRRGSGATAREHARAASVADRRGSYPRLRRWPRVKRSTKSTARRRESDAGFVPTTRCAVLDRWDELAKSSTAATSRTS